MIYRDARGGLFQGKKPPTPPKPHSHFIQVKTVYWTTPCRTCIISLLSCCEYILNRSKSIIQLNFALNLKVFHRMVLNLSNTERSVRDFPAALAAKILRHHMQREDEPSHSPICCKQLLASKQSESYSSLLKDPKILKVFAELFSKKRPAGGTRPHR